MGLRPRLLARSRRLIVPLGEQGAAALHAQSVVENRSIKSIVLTALSEHGGIVVAHATSGTGGRTGAGRRRVKSEGYEISVDLPGEVMEQLRELAQRRHVGIGYLVLRALLAAGVPVEPSELVADRRQRGTRTPRRHYAHGVRAPRTKRNQL